jgi:hypothetical protein
MLEIDQLKKKLEMLSQSSRIEKDELIIRINYLEQSVEKILKTMEEIINGKS